MGVKFGFARVSTDDQDLSLQMAALEKEGIVPELVFAEHASGKTVKRANIERMFRIMTKGDTLVVWKLDRLGRDLAGVLEVIKRLNDEGIELISITERFDTATPMGKAFMQLSLVFAELERNMISERTKAGMAAKKAAGQKFGRMPLIWKGERGSAKRLAYLQGLEDQGLLRDPADKTGTLIPKAADVTKELNKAKNMSPGDRTIDNPETVRRWAREGFDGIVSKKEGQGDV